MDEEFSMKKEPEFFDKYIGKYVNVHFLPPMTVTGVLTEDTDGNLILNPVVDTVYENGYPEYRLVKKKFGLKIDNRVPVSLDDITEEELMRKLRFLNEQSRRENVLKDDEYFHRTGKKPESII